jgi:hypothetical protein
MWLRLRRASQGPVLPTMSFRPWRQRMTVPGITAIVAALVALAATTDSGAPRRGRTRSRRDARLADDLPPGESSAQPPSACGHEGPDPSQETRELQNRWDTVIAARAGLQTLALAGLLAALTVA